MNGQVYTTFLIVPLKRAPTQRDFCSHHTQFDMAALNYPPHQMSNVQYQFVSHFKKSFQVHLGRQDR